MLLLALKYALLALGAYSAWLLLRRFVRKTTLDNIPGPPAQSFLTGNLEQMYNKRDSWEFHRQLAENYGGVVKITGLLGHQQLYVFDPLALRHVVVEDQEIYQESPHFLELNRLIFGMGITGSTHDRHRKQRKMITPVFSTGHLRGMLPIFYEVVGRLRKTLNSQVADGPIEVEMMDWLARTALELIGRTGMGTSFEPLTDEETRYPYTKSVKQLLPTIFKFSPVIPLVPMLTNLGSPWFRRLLVNLTPSKTLHQIRDMIDLMDETSQKIYAEKKAALLRDDMDLKEGMETGRDLMSILLKANVAADEDSKLSESELLAQIQTFVFTAVDTTSSAMSRILYLLSHHPDVQDKLRSEILEAKEAAGGELTHDELLALPYLDAVMKETLRLHPPLPTDNRIAGADIVLPLSKPFPGRDGNLISSIMVPKGTTITIGIMASNRNKDSWGKDASEWKPERWLNEESMGAIKVPGVFSNLMTFLGGGRACVGFMFSQLEMKVVISTLIGSFKFSPLETKKVEFNMGWAITVPTIDGRVQLPLKMEKA